MPESHAISLVTEDMEGQGLGQKCGHTHTHVGVKQRRARRYTPRHTVCMCRHTKQTHNGREESEKGGKKQRLRCKEQRVSAGLTLKEMRGSGEIELGDKRKTMRQRPSGSGTLKGKGRKD